MQRGGPGRPSSAGATTDMVIFSEPHGPDGRDLQGHWVYAPLGELQVTGAGAYVVCHACGDLLTHISAAHLSRHDLTPSAYRQRYRLPAHLPLTSPAARARRTAVGNRRWGPAGDLRTPVLTRAHAYRAEVEARAHQRATELGYRDLHDCVRQLYRDQGQTLPEVALMLTISRRVLLRLLDEAGVARRDARFKAGRAQKKSDAV